MSHSSRSSNTSFSSPTTSSSRTQAGHSQSSSSSGRSSGRSLRFDPPSKRLSPELLELTVTSIMEGVQGAKILVPPLCRVAELKSIVADATDVPADKQVLLYNDVELKNDSNTIATYGITKDCNITLNIKMSTGSKVARSHVNMSMLFMPLVMQQGSIPSLRNTIKQMTSVRGRPIYRGKVDTSKEYSTTWTPAKQMEHELTRNRMRRLLRTRTTRKILTEASSRASPTPTQTDTEKRLDVVSSSTSSDTKSTSKSSKKSAPAPYEQTLTEKQLKVFFDPPESVEELEIIRNNLMMPPANIDELLEIKADRRKSSNLVCKFCHRKLALTEQHIRCLCEQRFCKKHRLPSAHLCGIDYKQTGRSRINKENPKISEGGYHKARED